MGRNKQIPSQELLSKISEIARIKKELSLMDRSRTSGLELYVQSSILADGSIIIAAGGRFIPKLKFITYANGSYEVYSYTPGDWEVNVDSTLAYCHGLVNAPEKHRLNDTLKKVLKYPFSINLAAVARVDQLYHDKYPIIDENWQINGRRRQEEFAATFIITLEKEHIKEYGEIVHAINMNADFMKTLLSTNIARAYGIGFMWGKSWISVEEQTYALSQCAEHILQSLLTINHDSHARRAAFYLPLAQIALQGALDANELHR